MNEGFKFDFRESMDYSETDSEYNEYFILNKFKYLDLTYTTSGFLYLKDILEEFGMFNLAKEVPIYLGWDKTRNHEFKHRWQKCIDNFAIEIILNPYDISKEA